MAYKPPEPCGHKIECRSLAEHDYRLELEHHGLHVQARDIEEYDTSGHRIDGGRPRGDY